MKFFIAMALVALACASGASAAFDMKASFGMIDADMNGVVTADEFDGLYKTFDDDGNGEINATEFVTHFMKTGMSVQGSLYLFFATDSDHNQVINSTEVDYFFYVLDNGANGAVTYNEYASVMNTVLAHLVIAAADQPNIDAIFDAADVNGDGDLAPLEFGDLLKPADTNVDDIVTEDEFVTFWMKNTNQNEERSRRLFHILSLGGAGLGGDAIKAALFNAFDYTNDGTVSRDEMHNALLNLFAQVMRGIDQTLANSFDNPSLNRQNLFNSMDTNMDSQISESEAMMGFNTSDVDHDGKLNLTEFVVSHTKMGFSVDTSLYMLFYADVNVDTAMDASEMRMSFHHKDQNKDGSISMDEFNRALDFAVFDLYPAGRAAPKMAAMVYAVDANGDDELTIDELKNLTSEADPDGDGNIKEADFVKFWTTHTGFSDYVSTHLFHAFDADGDGTSTVAERTTRFVEFDNDKTGTVSMDEYRGAMLYMYAAIKRNEKKEAWMEYQGSFNSTVSFMSADTNKDGKIDASEKDAAFAAVDTDSSGVLSGEEFFKAYITAGLSYRGAMYVYFRTDNNEDQEISKAEYDTGFDNLDMDDNNMVSEQEYISSWAMLGQQMSEAGIAGMREKMAFDWADTDANGNLTYAELSHLFAVVDTDKDGLVSEAEFKRFWMFETGEPADRAELMFSYLDGDDDGQFGNDQESQQLFDAFDYEDDNVLTQDEFLNTLLNMFARSVEDIELQKMADAVVGFFF